MVRRAVALVAIACLSGCADGAKVRASGEICGAVRCRSLPSNLATSLASSFGRLRTVPEPGTAPTYLIFVRRRPPGGSARSILVWVPARHTFLVSRGGPHSPRLVWYGVPASITTQLAKAERILKPNPAPEKWIHPQPLPYPPANALGKAERSLCRVENCARINRMIASWLHMGGIPRRHAVGALYLYTSGCLNCHRYRKSGGMALGAPDLTHIGNRLSGRALRRVIRCPNCVQPGSAMPAYGSLPKRVVDELTAFLGASR